MREQKTSEIVQTELDKIMNYEQINDLCLTTGFSELDTYLGGQGLEPGTLTVIGARPAMGKTSLILNMVHHQLNAIEEDESILYINARDGKTNLVQRLLAMSSRVNIKDIQLRRLTNEDKQSVLDNPLLTSLKADQLVLENASSFKIADIEALVKHTNSVKKLRLLVVDTIQSLDAEKSKDVDEGYYFMMQTLQTIAVAYNIPVIIASDVHRRVEWAKEGRVPKLEDLLGSAHIGHMADNCLMLVRPEYYQVPGEYAEENLSEAHLILRKSQHGHTLTVIKLDTELKKQLFLDRNVPFKELLHRYSIK
jgi:replicative DNA helicase